MRSLPTSPPAWVADYIGIPFVDRGRDRRGLDCWGLTRLIYAERFGVLLASRDTDYAHMRDRQGIAQAFHHETGNRWSPVNLDTARLGDVLELRFRSQPGHCGVMVAHQHFVHAIDGIGVCIEHLSEMWLPRLISVRSFRGPVVLRGRPAPFAGSCIDAEIPAGHTISELISIAGVVSDFVHVFIGGVEIPRDHWSRVKPRPGRVVTIGAVPQGGAGGGKNVLRIVGTLAIVAAAAYFGQVYAVPALGTFGGALATAGVGLAGTLALNALIPAPTAKLTEIGDDSAKTSPTITGGRNEVRPYGVIPLALGDYRWAPPYAALPFVEISGDDQYLRCLFNIGYGPVEMSEIRIGETGIEEYEGVEIEFRPGRADDTPLSLYPSTVREEALSLELLAASSWVQRTSERDATELAVDVTFPTGLAEYKNDGSRENVTVDVEVQYRLIGTTDWLWVNGDGGAIGSPLDFRQMDLMFRTPEVRFGGAGVHTGRIGWSQDQVAYPDAKPAYLGTAGYSWIVEGAIYAPTSGSYQFCLDSCDAADVHVDGREAASWYGSHAPELTEATIDSTTHAGAVMHLARGWHSFRARMEYRSGLGAAFAVGWKRPGDPAFTIIPSTSLSREMRGNPTGELNFGWYHTGGYASVITTTEARAEAIRRSLAWAVPSGQYEVRVRRTTHDTDSTSIVDGVFWTTLRSISPRDPINATGIAKLAMRIKATDQLQGAIDTLTVRTKSIMQDWDASAGAWIERATSNAASHMRAILEGRGNKRPIATSRIDVDEFALLHEESQARGLAFDGVIDFGSTVFQVVNDVASSARASFGMRDGRFSPVRDRSQTVPIQHFTPKNTRGFKGAKAFTAVPHAMRVRFPNAAKGYEIDERLVLDDGYQIDGLDAWGNEAPTLPPATQFEVLEVFGSTSPEQAFRHGRYFLAVMRLRPEMYQFETDVEHLACNRGDLVLLSHDVPQFGQSSGRVLALNTDASGNITGLVLDENVTIEAGEAYVVRVRLDDGRSLLRPLSTIVGVSTTVTLAGPISIGDPSPKVGDLWMFGRLGLETREVVIKSIEIGRDLAATITCVDHAPAVHLADVGTIPPFQSGIDRPPSLEERPDDPIIESIRSDDYVMIRDADGSLRPRMLVQLRASSGTSLIPTHVEVRIRSKPQPPAEGAGAWRTLPPLPLTNSSFAIADVEEGVTYELKVRTVTREGLTSRWVSALHTVLGKVLPPPDVEIFDVQRLSDGTRRYTWDLGDAPPDIAGVVIRFGPTTYTWDLLTPLHDGILQATPTELAEPAAGTWRFAIRAIDTSGNLSANPLYIERTLGEPPLDGVLFSNDEGAAGWPGTKTSCRVSTWIIDGTSVRILEARNRATWATLASYGAATWATWPRWNLAPESPISYESAVLDAGIVLDASPDALVVTDGATVSELAWSEDGVIWSEWTELSAARGISVMARYVKCRVTVDPTSSVTVCTIRRLVVMMRGEARIHELQDIDTSAIDAGSVVGVGDVYLPVPNGFFRVIRGVSLNFNGMGGGWSWELVERNAATGPRVRLYNSDDELQHATIDATIRGV